MNTKIILTACALFLGLIGIGLTFLPNEILKYLQIESNQIMVIFMQLLGALYLGFAMLNWMAKGSTIGGIYNRPIAIGNFMHFGVGAMALLKIAFSVKEFKEVIIPLAIVYTIFAVCFGYIFRANPSKVK
jgi:hypothetical protein